MSAEAFPHNRARLRRILSSAMVALLIIVVGASALLAYAGHAIDRIAEARETALVVRAIDRKLTRLKADVTSATIWDDAAKNTDGAWNQEWADSNFGVYYHQYMGHDVTLGLDKAGRVTYASRDGVHKSPDSEAALRQAVDGLVAKIRANEQRPRKGPSPDIGFAAVSTAEASVRTADGVYLVSGSTIVPDTDKGVKTTAPAPIVLSAKKVDAVYLKSLSQDLGVASPHLTGPARAGQSGPRVILRDAAGAPLAALTWRPEQPGLGILRQAAPFVGAIIVLLALAALLMIRRVSAILLQLALNERKLRRTLAELTTARDAAEVANVAKSQFLANMSHEIRTPLNGVLGMVQVMQTGELPPDQRERLAVIRQSGEDLANVLNDVLDLSRVEAGKLEIVAQPYRLEAVLQSTVAAFGAVAEANGLDLDLRLNPDVSGFWTGDASRVRQIVSNLVSNALKFTEVGGVTVLAGVVDGSLEVRVEDTGPGVPAPRLGQLFQKFSQLDNSATRRFGGAGLGLAISRQLAELMDGSLDYQTGESGGASFVLRLPAIRATTDTAADESAGPAVVAPGGLTGRPRVLAAEDNATNRLILSALLTPLGLDLTLVNDGEAAVAAVTDGAFDLVLMDVQMPLLDGIEATRAIRALELDRGLERTPILALSANVLRHQIEEYLEAGMDGHVAKPIDVNELMSRIQAALGAEQAPPTDVPLSRTA